MRTAEREVVAAVVEEKVDSDEDREEEEGPISVG